MDDGADDAERIGPPLPPDDRLWRHPSELSASRAAPSAPRATGSPGRGASWPIAAVAALVGAVLSAGLLALTGALAVDSDRVVEKVSLSPVVSSPIVRGDRGIIALTEDLRPVVARLVLRTGEATSRASAIIYRDDGLLLTSARALDGATAVTVLLHDGRDYEAEVLGVDLPTDVAVLRVRAQRLDVAVLGTATDLEVGAPTLALGAHGVDGEDPYVASGIVSATGQRMDLGGDLLHGMIQTDAPVERAWAGGPLVDASGAVVGVTVATGDSAFGYATPIDLVMQMAAQLIESGRVAHAWLGVEGGDLTHAASRSLGVSAGALVLRVLADSPAERAGLSADDVVTELAGRPVRSSSALVVAVLQLRPGDRVVVGYWRDGRRGETTLTCEERPEQL